MWSGYGRLCLRCAKRGGGITKGKKVERGGIATKRCIHLVGIVGHSSKADDGAEGGKHS